MWLLKTPPHLKYVATLPYHLSLFACFLTLMFRKVVWQHMQAPSRSFIKTDGRIEPFCKNFVNRLRFDRIMAMSVWPYFLAHPVYALE